MSLLEPTDARQHVLDRAIVAIKKAGRNNTTLVAHAEAQLLLVQYPGCKLSLAELQEEITRLAVREGVALQFG